MDFNFDNDKQTIMGIYIKDYRAYISTRDAMLFNVYEGWKPTQEDVKRTIHNLYHPTEQQKRDFKKIFGKELKPYHDQWGIC